MPYLIGTGMTNSDLLSTVKVGFLKEIENYRLNLELFLCYELVNTMAIVSEFFKAFIVLNSLNLLPATL